MNSFAPRLRRVLAAGLLMTAAAAGATDIVRAALPSDIADGVAQVAQRRLHLPPGHWVLVAREEVETVGRKQQSGTGIEAWIARADGGRLGAMIRLSLPQEDFANVHRQSNNRCPEQDGIQRADLSSNPTLPECLGVYGHRDLAQALAARSPEVAAWLASAKVDASGPAVRFTYRQRTGYSYGGISLFLPAEHFESDEVAGAWARTLRDVCRPLFEGRERDVELPSPPAAADTAPAN